MSIYRTINNEGYRAQARGLTMRDNPYTKEDDILHREWRKGYIEAFNDEHGNGNSARCYDSGEEQ